MAYVCEICAESFPKLSQLHRRTENHWKKFECDRCGKCFSRKDNLDLHRKNMRRAAIYTVMNVDRFSVGPLPLKGINNESTKSEKVIRDQWMISRKVRRTQLPKNWRILMILDNFIPLQRSKTSGLKNSKQRHRPTKLTSKRYRGVGKYFQHPQKII